MERKSYIDFMKGIAIIGVIIIHITTERLALTDTLSDLITYEALYGLSRFAVPVFFMVTGYLMLSRGKLSIRKIYLNYVLRIIICAFIYGIIYKIIRVVFDGEGDTIVNYVTGYITDFATGRLEFHFWYVYAIVGIYITMPILFAFVKGASRRVIEYYLIMWALINTFFVLSKSGYIPFVANVLDSYHFVGIFVEYIGYPVLGYYLMHYDFSKRVKVISVISGFAAAAVAICFTILDKAGYGVLQVEYLAYCGIFVIIYSIAICMIVKHIPLNYESLLPKIICNIGRHTLGIYFIHMVFVILIFQYGICNYYVLPVVDVIIYTLVVLALSYIIAFVVRKIPFAGRWIS